MNNSNEEIVNGANPSIIWTQYMDFLSEFGRQMKSTYTKKMRANQPITWSELDVINKQIHDKLDYLMTWSEKFNQNNNATQQQNTQVQPTTESVRRNINKIRLSESQLHKVIKESVKKILREGKRINNRVPFPLSDMDYVNDDGDIKTLRKDKFADEYTSSKAEAKRKERSISKRTEKMRRLFYDGILKDTSLEANLSALKQGDDKWMNEPSQWGAAQWMYFDPTEGKRVGATPLMELWEIDGMYHFIVRKGKEKEVLGY